MNLADNVFLLGQISNNDLIDLYASADVFVLPSRSESYGIVLLEAAASGIPIVSTDVGAAMEVVQQGVTGFVHDNVDDKFADAIVKALTDDKIHANAIACRDTILEKYNWVSITTKLETVYYEIA